MTITELSIKRPTLIIVIFITLALLGLFGYQQLRYELFPDISIPVISITTIYPGASAKEVESGISRKIEDVVSGVNKIEKVYSYSREGVSNVVMEFSQEANLDVLTQDVERKLNQVQPKLPNGAKSPMLKRISINDQPVLRIGANALIPATDFYQLVKENLVADLSQVGGVGLVSLIGGAEREIKVHVDAEKLRAYGLSILQVIQAVKMANLDFPTGNIKDQDGQFIVRLAGKFNSLTDLKELHIGKARQGGEIKLRDLAEVVDGRKEIVNINRVNGQPSLGIIIQKQSDANAVEVCQSVRQKLIELEKSYQKIGLQFSIAQDSSIFTIEAAHAVWEDLGIAILLVAAVMLLFLHSWRNSAIVMVAIPASLVSTFIGMWIFDFTLNMVTLLALSLVIGILVDDSIVVLENIYKFLERGEEKKKAALVGRNEIGFTALSITLVDVVVFLPLALVTGVIGGITRQFSLMVVTSTMMSLFVSFTITPMLASRFSKLEKLTKDTLMGRLGLSFENFYDRLNNYYLSALRWSLQHRFVVLLSALLLFVGSITLIPLGFIGSEFSPQIDRGEFMISISLDPGTRLEETNNVSRQIEKYLLSLPVVEKVFANIGASSSGFLDQSSSNVADLQVSLVEKEERQRSTIEISTEIKNHLLSKLPGVDLKVSPLSMWGTGGMTPVGIVVSGTSWEKVFAHTKRLKTLIEKVPGTSDVRLSVDDGNPETRIEVDRAKMATFGLSVADVGNTLRIGLTGDDESKFRDQDGNEYDLRILLDENDRSSTMGIANLTVMNRLGQGVPLKQFTEIYQTTGPNMISRTNRNYSVNILSQAVGRPAGDIGGDIKKLLAKERAAGRLPADIQTDFAGSVKQMETSFISLGIALLAAIIFVYLIMVALYDSFIYPFIVLFAVPLAIIGALVALALTMNSLGIFSILGIIMQVGLVSKNAILLVDFTTKLRAEGLAVREAILEAGRERLRPILMTTLTMIFGMLPIALSTAKGGEFKHGLGWGLIGGLTSSMLMTLIVVPVVYTLIDGVRTRFFQLFKKKQAGSPVAK